MWTLLLIVSYIRIVKFWTRFTVVSSFIVINCKCHASSLFSSVCWVDWMLHQIATLATLSIRFMSNENEMVEYRVKLFPQSIFRDRFPMRNFLKIWKRFVSRTMPVDELHQHRIVGSRVGSIWGDNGTAIACVRSSNRWHLHCREPSVNWKNLKLGVDRLAEEVNRLNVN